MSNNTQQASGGVGCLSVLGILFIGLKLTNNIDWSWLWVLAPFWGPFALIIVGGIIYVSIHMLARRA